MEITRADLEIRMATLKERLEKLKADCNAHVGAIQDCDYWLDVLNKTSAPVSSSEEK